MNRPLRNDDESIVLWNFKPVPHASNARLIVVLHRDAVSGEMIAERLQRDGFAAVHHTEASDVELMLGHWQPGVLLIDMRLAAQDVRRLVQATSHDPALARTLVIAITDPAARGETTAAREAGFDGLCHGPCQVSRLVETLEKYLAGALHGAGECRIPSLQ